MKIQNVNSSGLVHSLSLLQSISYVQRMQMVIIFFINNKHFNNTFYLQLDDVIAYTERVKLINTN